MKHQRSWGSMRTAAVVVATVPFVYPFVFIAFTALKPENEFRTNKLGAPHSLTFAHLRSAWHRADLGSALVNSALVCTLGVAVLLVTTSLGAYWFLRNQNRIGKILLVVFIGAWALPVVTWIVPLFVLLSQLGQTNNLIVLGFAYGALNAPFGLYLFYTFFREGVPPEIIEAGEVDGASTFQQFRSIVLPVSAPAIATVAALGFAWTWGELLLAVSLIQTPGHWTVPIAASTFTSFRSSDPQGQAAAALIAVIPVAALFLVAQRAIVRGMTAGVGK
jgi:raffinose/stachyose/melibiose transport system permease protein